VTCPKCGGQVLVEALGEGRVRTTCQQCHLSEVRDEQGRRMLTDNMPHPSGPGKLITG
jgi:hypothetical protein